VVYTIDDGQLLGLWTGVRFLGVVREIPDEEDRSELLTHAQMLLTEFVLGLRPSLGKERNSCPLSTRLQETAEFDA
jgi:hypothetical protein